MLLLWEGKGKPTITTEYIHYGTIYHHSVTPTLGHKCAHSIYTHTHSYTLGHKCAHSIYTHTHSNTQRKNGYALILLLTHIPLTHTHTHTHTHSIIHNVHPTGEENHIRVATQWLRKPTVIHMRFIDTFRLQPGSPRQVWGERGGVVTPLFTSPSSSPSSHSPPSFLPCSPSVYLYKNPSYRFSSHLTMAAWLEPKLRVNKPHVYYSGFS